MADRESADPTASEATRFRVSDDEAGRIDKIVTRRFPGVGRRAAAELFRRGLVRIDGRRAKKGDHAGPGSEVTLAEMPADHRSAPPDPDPDAVLSVVYEDADLVAGIAVTAQCGKTRRYVKGTLYHVGERVEPRVVQIDDYLIEAAPTG
ncbi:MAG: S4 domain-containing protein, partial [Myxococcota bacterium]